ncbi:DUF3871 family protein [Bacteroides neonati]|uniref:DUF3871 family protein n=1 Tax=Bacteroides neonati TaxID=1347393 RepID=UPI0004AD3C4E|nr:DUF3871 family protein [Bacteroides neonati]
METNLLITPSQNMMMVRANDWKQEVEDAVLIMEQPKKHSPFIEANTTEVTLGHLKNDCIIPTFAKDNEVCISHQNFIESVYEATKDFYHGEIINTPDIRTSHIVKGRIPEAINKRVDQLLESDKTMYYERMIFNIEIPSIHQDVNGNQLNLSITGCKSYARDNLSGKMAAQKFSIAVGFLNLACTNQCLSTDGYKEEIKGTSSSDLYKFTLDLFSQYNVAKHIHLMQSLGDTMLSEHQFCQILGRMRLYNYLPQHQQKKLPRLLITDSQINNVARQYIHDDNFAGSNGELSMWKFYNLLTGANKNSYLDSFLGRSVNATEVSMGLTEALNHKDEAYSWFIE